MALTVDYKEGVLKDIRENPDVAREYYREAMTAMVNGENEVASTMFRDLVKAGIGFQRLAKETGISAPNLHRALSVRGNPTMRTFGKIAASISAYADGGVFVKCYTVHEREIANDEDFVADCAHAYYVNGMGYGFKDIDI